MSEHHTFYRAGDLNLRQKFAIEFHASGLLTPHLYHPLLPPVTVPLPVTAMSEGPVTRRKRSLGSTGSPIDTPPSSLLKRQRLPNGESASRSNSRASVNGSDDGGDHSDKDLGSRDSNDEVDEEEGDWGDPLGGDADSSARGVDGGRSLRRKDSGFGGEKAATSACFLKNARAGSSC
jgi:hypothetical protein